MNISFRDKKLKELANDDRKAVKVLGKIMAEKYRLRLYHLHNAATVEDIRNLPGLYPLIPMVNISG